MRSKLLITTSALLAGIAVASAQNMPGGGRDSGPAAQSQGGPGGAAGQDRQPPQQSPGQAQQGSERADAARPEGPDHRSSAAARSGSARNQDQSTGQGQRDQSPSQSQQSPTQAQTPQRQQGQGAQQGQAPQQGAAPQGQAQQGQAGGNATLTTEQRTKIRQTVLTGGNVPRATNVNFSVSVGTVVPRSVRVVAVPSTIVEIHPQWRGFLYFVVGDEIIIVDRDYRIVAVIAA